MKIFLVNIALLLVVVSIRLQAQQVLPLYPEGIPADPEITGNLKHVDTPTLAVYLPAKEKSTGTAVVIFPGGAYAFWAYKEEGTDIAASFVQQGIAAFVVKYRLPGPFRLPNSEEIFNNGSYCPLQDAQQAIKTVRMNALKWGLNVNRVGIIGFSAGGHLASTLATHFTQSYIPNKENTNLRPDFVALVYPVISMRESLTHMDSRMRLLGMQPSDDKIHTFSNEEQVTAKTPPTWLTHAEDDELVSVNNSVQYYEALVTNHVPAEMHLFPKGNHSFVLREPAEQWMAPLFTWMKGGGWL